jgi:peptidoglycan biosynthesis protein MviN/MurJ (putative lipid II flippase)
MRDTWTPTLVGTGAWIVALPMYYLLQQSYGVFGLALASTAGILLYAAALYGILMRRTVGRRGVPELIEYGKLTLAAALAGTAGYFLLGGSSRFIAWETVFGSMVRLACGASFVGGVYFLLAFLFHSVTVRTIHRRQDLLHPPGSIPGEGGGGDGITPS